MKNFSGKFSILVIFLLVAANVYTISRMQQFAVISDKNGTSQRTRSEHRRYNKSDIESRSTNNRAPTVALDPPLALDASGIFELRVRKAAFNLSEWNLTYWYGHSKPHSWLKSYAQKQRDFLDGKIQRKVLYFEVRRWPC